jgi:16S rRNA C967 or C1407 C5-methylase (RsmB/RsmF family)
MIQHKEEVPVKFTEFLKLINTQTDYYTAVPRYIRFKHGYTLETVRIVQQELKTHLSKIEWMPGFYSLDQHVGIASSSGYAQGLFVGMDVSSAVAVNALEIAASDHVLDLCCAPGAKSCYIAELMGDGMGTITGVDISKQRLFTAKRQVLKHGHDRIRLFCCDGTMFNVPPPSRVGPHLLCATKQQMPDDTYNFQVPLYASRMLRGDKQLRYIDHLYDKVLVDAECTHDGSVAHIEKYIKNGWDGLEEKFLNKQRLESLESLQKSLLENGFRQLKPGGLLVYSTCSTSRLQNEGIIEWFLDKYSDAILEAIPNIDAIPTAPLEHPTERISHCIRMDPKHSNASGFFIARIRKCGSQ